MRNLKTQRNDYPQSSDYYAKHIFTQFLVSAFIFTANFPENVISTQSLSTKLVRFSIFAQDFSVTISINFFEKIGEKLSV